MKNIFRSILLLTALGGFMLTTSGCGTVPAGASSTLQVNAVKLQATGAGIVKANEQFTTYKIKCAVCGYISEDIMIPTPQAGKPYTLYWVCPKCGHKQTIMIQAV